MNIICRFLFLLIIPFAFISCNKSSNDREINAYDESNLKIALVQTVPEPVIEINLKNGDNFCRQAKETGADIVVFPEM